MRHLAAYDLALSGRLLKKRPRSHADAIDWCGVRRPARWWRRDGCCAAGDDGGGGDGGGCAGDGCDERASIGTGVAAIAAVDVCRFRLRVDVVGDSEMGDGGDMDASKGGCCDDEGAGGDIARRRRPEEVGGVWLVWLLLVVVVVVAGGGCGGGNRCALPIARPFFNAALKKGANRYQG